MALKQRFVLHREYKNALDIFHKYPQSTNYLKLKNAHNRFLDGIKIIKHIVLD